MEWWTIADYIQYVFIITFLFFIPWVVFVSRRQQGVSRSVIDISNESIKLARQSLEIHQEQLQEMRKMNDFLHGLCEKIKDK